MNPIETMERHIQHAVPAAWTRIRRPRKPDGEWWLDAKKDDHVVTVQWSPRRGFGISASAIGDGYGEGPEETFPDGESAANRVIQLLRTKGHTVPPPSVVLRELRGLVGLTQEQLAEKLGVQQAAVSRMERREEITLGSLRRYVAALGAELEITIRTPNGEQVRLSELGGPSVERATCFHVDAALATAEPDTAELPHSICRNWLEQFERTARSRWPLVVSGLWFDTSGPAMLGSMDLCRRRVALDLGRVQALARDVGRSMRCTSLAPERAFQAVARYLLAHEVGHLVDRDMCPDDSVLRRFLDRELCADAVAGWLGGRAGDDPLAGSIIASRLGCQSPDCTHPSPAERSHAYLTGHVWSTSETPAGRMNLFVIRTLDLERSYTFYSGLGLKLQSEQHPGGPLHYSCNLAGTVVELYPTKSKRPGTRFGLQLPSLAARLDHLLASNLLPEAPSQIPREPGPHIWLIKDPDGNTLELEPTECTTARSP